MSKTYNTYSRLSYYSEVGASDGTNEYLYDYLSHDSNEESISCWRGEGDHPEHDSFAYGYWLLSFATSECAHHVFANGYIFGGDFCYYYPYESSINGVRPVITLDL